MIMREICKIARLRFTHIQFTHSMSAIVARWRAMRASAAPTAQRGGLRAVFLNAGTKRHNARLSRSVRGRDARESATTTKTKTTRTTRGLAVVRAEQREAAPSREGEVLKALSTIMDPDFGMNIVECGFVKALKIEGNNVSFALELTTPACPIKDEFERSALERVSAIDWVDDVQLTMTAQAVQANDTRPNGLKNVKHVVAVSSCKGAVGKSTTSVNLAYMCVSVAVAALVVLVVA